MDAYLATRFGSGTLSAEVAQRLHVQTTGNPLFLLNAVEDLEQRRWLECVDGTWGCTVAPERLADAVPESTRAMIDSRLARLPAECLTMLEAASVIGSSFDGVATLREGARLLADASRLIYAPYYAAQAAAGLLRFELVDEASSALDEAFALLDQTDGRWCEPELHRLRGEIVLTSAVARRVKNKAREQAARQAEAFFHRAIGVAREQGARWWEMTALRSLARSSPPGAARSAASRQLAELHEVIDHGGDVAALRAVRELLAATRP